MTEPIFPGTDKIDQTYGRVRIRPLFEKVSAWLRGDSAKAPYAGHVPPRPLPPPAPPEFRLAQQRRRELEDLDHKIALAKKQAEIPATHKLNADQTVAVATDVYFNPDMSTAPRGVKLQLIGEGGVAVYGTYNGDPFWQEWAPVPKRRKGS